MNRTIFRDAITCSNTVQQQKAAGWLNNPILPPVFDRATGAYDGAFGGHGRPFLDWLARTTGNHMQRPVGLLSLWTRRSFGPPGSEMYSPYGDTLIATYTDGSQDVLQWRPAVQAKGGVRLDANATQEHPVTFSSSEEYDSIQSGVWVKNAETGAVFRKAVRQEMAESTQVVVADFRFSL